LLRDIASQTMGDSPPTEMPCRLALTVFYPVPQSWSKKKRAAALSGETVPTVKPDIDNIVKIVGDALNEIVWRDDKQIYHVRALKLYGERPRTEIGVVEIV